jgi:hypothetical protein
MLPKQNESFSYPDYLMKNNLAYDYLKVTAKNAEMVKLEKSFILARAISLITQMFKL